MNSRNRARSLTLVIIFTIAALIAPISAQGANPPLTGSQALAKWDGDKFPATGLWLQEDFNLGFNQSALYKNTNSGGVTQSILCAGLNDTKCQGGELYQILNLDLCTDNSQLSCIAGIWATDQTGKRINGELVKSPTFESSQYVEENVSENLPKSSSFGGIWKIPGVVNGAGNENYFAATRITMFKAPAETKFGYGEIESGIIPIRELTGNYGLRVLDKTGGQNSTGPSRAPSGEECIALEAGVCRERVDFPANYRFGMTLRIGEKLSGWYHGRLTLPNIDIKDWKNGQEMSIEGEPVKIPSLDFVVPNTELSEDAKKKLADCAEKRVHCGGRGKIGGIVQFVGNLNHPLTTEWMKAFNKDYQDRATKTQTSWSFKKMFNHAGTVREDELKRCGDNSGSLTGLVLTNSLVYSSGPPAFEPKSGSLIYTVTSPHFESSGEVASGTYDLTLRSAVARCIYGFSNAPIKADISITGDDGEKRIATTVVNEKDGWLYLSAKGFTYSAPTIQVKLSQDQVAKVEEVKNSSASATVPRVTPAKKTISITCVKGKSVKKVTGNSPKCPAGFKKK